MLHRKRVSRSASSRHQPSPALLSPQPALEMTLPRAWHRNPAPGRAADRGFWPSPFRQRRRDPARSLRLAQPGLRPRLQQNQPAGDHAPALSNRDFWSCY